MTIHKRSKANRFFDVAAPHRKARRPVAYHIPLLAKLHLYGPHRKKKQALVLGGTLAALLLLILVFQVESLFANLRTLHPATCSGDWQDASSLTGEPEIGEQGALATDAGQKIFCSFALPKLTEPVPLTRAVLAFSFKNEQPTPIQETLGTEATATTTDEMLNEEVLVEEVIAEPAPEETVIEASPETTTEESPVEEPTPETTPEPEPVPEPQVEEPVSWWKKLFFASVVYAQEESVAEEEPVSEEPPVEEPGEEVIPEEVPVEEAGSEEPPTEEIQEIIEENPPQTSESTEPETKLTISYTLDGVLWADLTTFSPKDNEVTFDLDVTSSDQVEKLVVRVTAEEVGGEPVYLRAAELRIWTEAPLEELLEPILEEATPGVRVYDREFVIDPDATHSCLPEPLTIDLSATTTTSLLVHFSLGEDIGEGLRGIIADVSEEILQVIEGTPEVVPETLEETEHLEISEPEIASTSPQDVSEDPATSTEEQIEEAVATTTEIYVEKATTTESVTEEASTGPLEALIESGIDVLESVARIKIGVVEVGGLPSGIDIRFASTTSPYVAELYEDSELTALLEATIVAPETAQQGSFSVPIIFTRTDGGESTVVCQVNIINRPGDVRESDEEPESES